MTVSIGAAISLGDSLHENHNQTQQMKTTKRQNLVAALACAVAFTTTTQAQIPFARDSRVSLSLPLQGSENLTYGAVTESSGGEPDGERAEPEANQPGEQHLVHLESVQ